MGERKVLNKYYPPDFDPAKLPRVRRPLNQQIKVRMMLPMSIRCNTCGNYIYKGTKFNSRKEDVAGDTYLGIQIFRFYFKCTRCSAELTIKTDPQNSDYVVEAGAQRNYEPWRTEDELLDREKQKRESEEVGDAMKSLENRTLDSKREMDIMAALDEMKSMKSRHASVSVDAMLQALQRASEDKDKQLELEDEALIKSIVFHNSKDYIRRIEDSDDSDDDSDKSSGANSKRQKVSEWTRIKPTDSLTSTGWTDSFASTGKKQDPGAPKKLVTNSSTVLISVKKKQDATSKDNNVPRKSETGIVKSNDDKNVTKPDETKQMSEQKKTNDSGNNVLQSLCQAYGDSDDEIEDN